MLEILIKKKKDDLIKFSNLINILGIKFFSKDCQTKRLKIHVIFTYNFEKLHAILKITYMFNKSM